MRWLLLKDLQILRRSPLLVALLLAYGGLVGALLGFAVQRDDAKPKVAFLNEVPSDGGRRSRSARQKIDASQVRQQACSSPSTRSASRRARRRSTRCAAATRSPR